MDRRFVHLSIGLVACTLIASLAWTRVRLARPTAIDVRGSAKRRINSDFVSWAVQLSATKRDRVEAYRALQRDVGQVLAFLDQAQTPAQERVTSSVDITEQSHQERQDVGGQVVSKSVFDGWQAAQRIEVKSTDVPKVEKLSREITQLLEKEVMLSSESPQYHYTKVGELKIEMLGEAAKDARQRAERMLSSAGSGSRVGRVLGVDTGVININAANSTETSWEGNYDLSSFEKDIITTVRVRFEVLE